MNLLLDTCVWGGARSTLADNGHDVIWTGSWEKDPGDEEIIKYAFKEGRTLVTLDKDFGELAILHRLPHHGIIRLVGIGAHDQAIICLEVLDRYTTELLSGAIITAEFGRFRIRPSSSSL
jgi:predicted nuclease of predicted toxin-antitoxin system